MGPEDWLLLIGESALALACLFSVWYMVRHRPDA